MHDERARLWSNVSLFETILEFFLTLVSVLELTLEHMRDGLLFTATARAGVSGRVIEEMLLLHDWKGAVYHLVELEAIRGFQFPVHGSKIFPFDDVKSSLVPPVFFA